MRTQRTLLFDPNAYRLLYPDTSDFDDAQILEHYLAYGQPEGRCPTALFDPVFYASQTGLSLQSACQHYIDGEGKDVSPHPLFDVAFYAKQAGDLSDPVHHYITEGWQRGLDPHPLFSTSYYLSQSHHFTRSGYDPLSDFILAGWKRGHNPNVLFDTNHYLRMSPDLQGAAVNPLIHYVIAGWMEHRSHHPLFDGVYYAAQIPAETDPLSHYLNEGCQLGYNPHPLFVTDYYLLHASDIIDVEINPLAHFYAFGGQELRPHHPLFDPRWYRDRTGCTGIPLVHYLESGGSHDPGPLFNSRWYLTHVPDARHSDLAPLMHWILEGARRGIAFSSLPLEESVLELARIGNVVGAATLLSSRLRTPDYVSKRRIALPLQINAHEVTVNDGYVIGGLPGVITTNGQLFGLSAPDRPRIVQLGGNSVALRKGAGMAVVEYSHRVLNEFVMVADCIDGSDWDWCTRRLPALFALADSHQVVISSQLSALALALTRHVLAPREIEIVELGSSLRVSNLRVIPEAKPREFRRAPNEASASGDSVLLVLDERDPFDSRTKSALVSELDRLGGRVIDTSWGISAIDESVATSTRVIAAAALPVVAYLARSGTTVIALLDELLEEHFEWMRLSGLAVDAVVLDVLEPPRDQHSPALLNPLPYIATIVGSTK